MYRTLGSAIWTLGSAIWTLGGASWTLGGAIWTLGGAIWTFCGPTLDPKPQARGQDWSLMSYAGP